jgi:CheY-like chemotaxis protein
MTPNLTPPAKIQVLVVEDNIINRKILVKILKASLPHLDVYEAEDGIDAVERFREFSAPVIVLLDINMPRMDGYSAAVEMRIIEKERAAEASGMDAAAAACATPMRRSKIIAVTALSGDDERHRGLVECGMDQWLTKPCPKSTLQKVVDEARIELIAWDL